MTEGKKKGQRLGKVSARPHVFVDENSKIIYHVRKVKGETIKFSTGVKYDPEKHESSLLKAARVVARREAEERKKKDRQGPRRLIGECLDELLAEVERSNKRRGTITSYRASVKHLKDYFDAHLPDEVTSQEWLNFVEYFGKKHPDFTLFNITKHFRLLVKRLHQEGVIQKLPRVFNPNQKKEEIRLRKKRHRIYEPAEILAMDRVCDEDQRLALWLGYDLGFRLDDCVSLEWERVHLIKSAPYIQFYGDENKTGFYGRVPLTATCARLLEQRRLTSKSRWVFPQKKHPSEPLAPQQLKFESVIRRSRVNYGSHHILRHTRLTEDFQNPHLSQVMVMKIRRVSLQVALKHYIHPTEEEFEKFRSSQKAQRGTQQDRGGCK